MNLCCVIVTFNPEIKNLARLVDALNKSECTIVIVDNNSSKKINDGAFSNTNLIHLGSNLGIANAQNFGINKAIELGADNIIFFDQDSEIDEKFIKNLTSDYAHLKKNGINVAAIGPQFIDKKLGFYAPGLIVKKNGLIDKIDIRNITESKEVGLIISSGSLIPVSALKDIGLMNEDFFIDYVDTEWCFRALEKGYKVYVSKNAVMFHSVGESTINIFGQNCPVHSAYRRYYRIRNLVLMMRMSHIKKLWILSMLINNLIAQLILFFTQKNKFSYVYYFILSIVDGLKGKKGSL